MAQKEGQRVCSVGSVVPQQGEERGGWSDRGRPRSSGWIVPRGGRRAWRRVVCADS